MVETEEIKKKEKKYNKRKQMEANLWNEEGVEGTDADQCMSSCSFWSLGLLLPASSRNTAGAALSLTIQVQQQQQQVVSQTRG